MHDVCVVLGSNIEPEKNLFSAWIELGKRAEITTSSSIWESPPFMSSGPNFLNAVLRIHTQLSRDDLKWKTLREIESRLGRVRSADKFAPRPIDLDILIFDGEVADANLWNLAFLAAPCSEILPNLTSPDNEPLSLVASRLTADQNTNRRYTAFEELSAAFDR